MPEQESHAGVCSPRGKRTCIKFSSSHWRDAYSTLRIERGRCYGAGQTLPGVRASARAAHERPLPTRRYTVRAHHTHDSKRASPRCAFALLILQPAAVTTVVLWRKFGGSERKAEQAGCIGRDFV